MKQFAALLFNSPSSATSECLASRHCCWDFPHSLSLSCFLTANSCENQTDYICKNNMFSRCHHTHAHTHTRKPHHVISNRWKLAYIFTEWYASGNKLREMWINGQRRYFVLMGWRENKYINMRGWRRSKY